MNFFISVRNHFYCLNVSLKPLKKETVRQKNHLNSAIILKHPYLTPGSTTRAPGICRP